MQHRLTTGLVAIAATITAALAAVPAAAAAEHAETWHLKSLFSHIRIDDGATQDTHWFYADPPRRPTHAASATPRAASS
jgi:hypothetical protein